MDLRSLVPLGTPSAWLFLVRLHACRAGLRFTRQNNYAQCCRQEQTENQKNQGETTVSSRRGLVRAIGRKFLVGAQAPPWKRWVVPVPGFDGSPVGENRLGCIGLKVGTNRRWSPVIAEASRRPAQ